MLTLKLVAEYKKHNLPLEEIKEKLEQSRSLYVENEKLAEHVDRLTDMMKHLELEMREMKPLLANLDDHQKESVTSKITPQSVQLAQTIMVLFG